MEKWIVFNLQPKKGDSMTAIMDVEWFISELRMFAGKDAEISYEGRGPIGCVRVVQESDSFSVLVTIPWAAKSEKDGWVIVSARNCGMNIKNPKIELMNGNSVKLSHPGCPQLGFVFIPFAAANIVPKGNHAARR